MRPWDMLLFPVFIIHSPFNSVRRRFFMKKLAKRLAALALAAMTYGVLTLIK